MDYADYPQRHIGRRSTPARTRYSAIARTVSVGSVTRGQLAVLAQSLPCTGLINATEAHLLTIIINTAHPESFGLHGKPIVFKSNLQLAFEVNRTPGRVSRLLGKLFDLGLITMQDSGNYKRYAIRNGDEITDACGIDLRILIGRYDELTAAVKDAKAANSAFTAAKRRYRGALRTMLITLGSSEPVGARLYHRVTSRLNKIQSFIRNSKAASADHLRRAVRLIERLSNMLHACEIDAKMTCTNVENDMHIQITNPNPIGISNDMRRPAHAGQNEPLAGYASEFAYEKSIVAPAEPVNLNQSPVAALDDVANAVAPVLAEWGLDRPRSWQDLTNLTPQMCRIAGISDDARRSAMLAMGANAAATAIAITLQKQHDRSVRSPGGYLRAMTDRAVSGTLHLHKSVFGLIAQNLSRSAEYPL